MRSSGVGTAGAVFEFILAAFNVKGGVWAAVVDTGGAGAVDTGACSGNDPLVEGVPCGEEATVSVVDVVCSLLHPVRLVASNARATLLSLVIVFMLETLKGESKHSVAGRSRDLGCFGLGLQSDANLFRGVMEHRAGGAINSQAHPAPHHTTDHRDQANGDPEVIIASAGI